MTYRDYDFVVVVVVVVVVIVVAAIVVVVIVVDSDEKNIYRLIFFRIVHFQIR